MPFFLHLVKFHTVAFPLWEVLLFGPEQVIETWDLGGNIVVYKLG